MWQVLLNLSRYKMYERPQRAAVRTQLQMATRYVCSFCHSVPILAARTVEPTARTRPASICVRARQERAQAGFNSASILLYSNGLPDSAQCSAMLEIFAVPISYGFPPNYERLPGCIWDYMSLSGARSLSTATERSLVARVSQLVEGVAVICRNPVIGIRFERPCCGAPRAPCR